jgi:hypothetical protein
MHEATLIGGTFDGKRVKTRLGVIYLPLKQRYPSLLFFAAPIRTPHVRYVRVAPDRFEVQDVDANR